MAKDRIKRCSRYFSEMFRHKAGKRIRPRLRNYNDPLFGYGIPVNNGGYYAVDDVIAAVADEDVGWAIRRHIPSQNHGDLMILLFNLLKISIFQNTKNANLHRRS